MGVWAYGRIGVCAARRPDGTRVMRIGPVGHISPIRTQRVCVGRISRCRAATPIRSHADTPIRPYADTLAPGSCNELLALTPQPGVNSCFEVQSYCHVVGARSCDHPES
jgi:hypothetical protein